MAHSAAAATSELKRPLLPPATKPSPFLSCNLEKLLFNFVAPSVHGSGAIALDPEPSGLADATACLRSRLDGKDESLLRSLVAVFWLPMANAAACKLASDLLRYVPPLLLSRLLLCLSGGGGSDCSAFEDYSLALLLPLTTLLQALLVNQYFWHALKTGVLVRGSLTAAICARSLKYRRRDAVDGGRLSNLISSDCGRLNTACGSLNMAWSAPLQLSLALGLLWRQLGPPVLGGLMVMVLLWPVQLGISRALAKQRAKTARATDVRLQRTAAALAAARAVKLERWEGLCDVEISSARQLERAALRREGLLKATNVLLVTLAPTLVSLCTFATLSLTGGTLHASTVFASLALFNLLRAPLSALPDLFAALAHGRVALERIERVVKQLDVEDAEDENAGGGGGGGRGLRSGGGGGGGRGGYIPPPLPHHESSRTHLGSNRWLLSVRDGTYSWCSHSAATEEIGRRIFRPLATVIAASDRVAAQEYSPLFEESWLSSGGLEGSSSAAAAAAAADLWILGPLNLKMTAGQLLVISGEMGCGKSSVLLALLGEMHSIHGDVLVDGAPPTSWHHATSSSLSSSAAAARETDRHAEEDDDNARPAFGYSGQRGWLTRGTIRENILFGRRYDPSRYHQVLCAVALDIDVSQWPRGDLSDAGELGASLSGGQQARVSLARVLYANPKVALLDEPLAALDPSLRDHVCGARGSHIQCPHLPVCAHSALNGTLTAACTVCVLQVWSHAIRGQLLADSAVVLTSSSMATGLHADLVCLLQGGAVVQCGSPTALAAAPGLFSDTVSDQGPHNAHRPVCALSTQCR